MRLSHPVTPSPAPLPRALIGCNAFSQTRSQSILCLYSGFFCQCLNNLNQYESIIFFRRLSLSPPCLLALARSLTRSCFLHHARLLPCLLATSHLFSFYINLLFKALSLSFSSFLFVRCIFVMYAHMMSKRGTAC